MFTKAWIIDSVANAKEAIPMAAAYAFLGLGLGMGAWAVTCGLIAW